VRAHAGPQLGRQLGSGASAARHGGKDDGEEAPPHATTLEGSEDLDLDRAVNQMTGAASICSEIYLGFDEKILVFSRAAALFFKIFNFSRPYWRYFPAANRLGLMTGLRFMYRPPDMSGLIRDCLRRQGYVGRLIQETVT
jgi:hypothetical protein